MLSARPETTVQQRRRRSNRTKTSSFMEGGSQSTTDGIADIISSWGLAAVSGFGRNLQVCMYSYSRADTAVVASGWGAGEFRDRASVPSFRLTSRLL